MTDNGAFTAVTKRTQIRALESRRVHKPCTERNSCVRIRYHKQKVDLSAETRPQASQKSTRLHSVTQNFISGNENHLVRTWQHDRTAKLKVIWPGTGHKSQAWAGPQIGHCSGCSTLESFCLPTYDGESTLNSSLVIPQTSAEVDTHSA